jgi:hypothetical protein
MHEFIYRDQFLIFIELLKKEKKKKRKLETLNKPESMRIKLIHKPLNPF